MISKTESAPWPEPIIGRPLPGRVGDPQKESFMASDQARDFDLAQAAVIKFAF
jgi:hypothetical protein